MDAISSRNSADHGCQLATSVILSSAAMIDMDTQCQATSFQAMENLHISQATERVGKSGKMQSCTDDIF